MATHSSILAWEILGTEERGELQPTGLQRVGHTRLCTDMHTFYLSINKRQAINFSYLFCFTYFSK